METCEATKKLNASDCPDSVKPHSFRRGAITAWLNKGHSKELVSDRIDVSTDVIEEHYDQHTEGEKRQLRRGFFEMDD
ncbi:hypothetical protein [Halorubrum salipaludis]|uniref:hypothetical protein n=1 Tax=Halorubrum salipaludis TaxID=2032630 RepID=UPI0011819331|nr:hypothetical protein [Halorubrum salipaludis]